MSQIRDELSRRVRHVMGLDPTSWRAVHRGYTAAGRYVVDFPDGSSAFVKAAVDKQTAAWLRDEQRVYDQVRADFVPKRLAWIDDELPLMILEDLSGGSWPRSWSEADIARTEAVLTKLASTVLPPAFPSLVDHAHELMGWQTIAADRSGFLGLHLTSEPWLSAALPALVAAERAVTLKGESLVHMDVRSDNLCFSGERTLLVDWNWARRGNPAFDRIAWLPSLHMEGGPPPWSITLADPEIIAAIAGYFASRAYLPPPAHPNGLAIRGLQLNQLKSALPWASRALGLPDPQRK